MFTFFRITFYFSAPKAKIPYRKSIVSVYEPILFLKKLNIPIYNFNQCVIIFPC